LATSNVWGIYTLGGTSEQQTAERYWRAKVGGLRGAIEASDVPAALGMRLAVYESDEHKARRLIDAALDGVDQETIAEFIYLLMWRIQGEAE
jgi:hypothetical protein